MCHTLYKICAVSSIIFTTCLSASAATQSGISLYNKNKFMFVRMYNFTMYNFVFNFVLQFCTPGILGPGPGGPGPGGPNGPSHTGS